MSELTADKTFYVRTDGLDTNNGLTTGNAFLTLQRAADETKKWRTGEFTLTVDIGKGLFGVSSDLDTGHPDGPNVYWTGVATEMTTGDISFGYLPGNITMPAHEGISHREIYVTLPENELPQSYPTDDWLFIRDASNGTNAHFLHGAHHLVAWMMPQAFAEFIWRYNDDNEDDLPGGEPIFEDVVMLVQTMVRVYAGASIRSSSGMHCGNWDNMVFDGSYVDCPTIWMSDRSEIVLGSHVGTYAGSPSLLCQSNAVIHADESVHMVSFDGNLVLAESGGFISLRDAVISTTLAEAVIARDNGTVDLRGSEVLYPGGPCSIKATRCGSINAANTTVLGCAPTGSVAFYMDTEGFIESNGATSDAEKLRNPPYDPSENVLTANKAFYVRTTGSDANDGLTAATAFLTPAKASEMVKKYVLGLYNITVNVGEGTFNCATHLKPGSGEGANIAWTGVAAAHTSLTINNIDGSATALSAGLEYIDFDVNFAGGSGAAVGMFVLVKTTSGGTNPNLVKGCHEIIAWAADVATVRCVRCAGVTKMPSGTITGATLTLVKTVLHFNSSSAGIFELEDKHCGTWNNMALKGSLSYNGVWMIRGASIVLGTNFGTSQWAANLCAQADSSIHADGSVHSYGQNYIVTADTDSFISITSTILSGCWDTGVRAYDRGTVNFQYGQEYCGGTYTPLKALRGGYVNAILSNIEGVTASTVSAFYATSGGGIDATSATDDAATSHVVAAGTPGAGAWIAY